MSFQFLPVCTTALWDVSLKVCDVRGGILVSDDASLVWTHRLHGHHILLLRVLRMRKGVVHPCGRRGRLQRLEYLLSNRLAVG